MKKTLIALLALAGVASGATLLPTELQTNWESDTVAYYDFDNTTGDVLANKSTSENKSGSSWTSNGLSYTTNDGYITTSDAGGQWSGFYNANIALSGDWAVSIQIDAANGAGTSRGIMQFGGENDKVMALYIGNGANDWGNLGLAFADGSRYALTSDSYKTGLHTYSISYTDGSLRLWVDSTDITSQLTLITGNGTGVDSSFDASTPTGDVTVSKIGYTNDFGPYGLASGTSFYELSAYSLKSVPEPATASLSLLGLAALMIRRRRA